LSSNNTINPSVTSYLYRVLSGSRIAFLLFFHWPSETGIIHLNGTKENFRNLLGENPALNFQRSHESLSFMWSSESGILATLIKQEPIENLFPLNFLQTKRKTFWCESIMTVRTLSFLIAWQVYLVFPTFWALYFDNFSSRNLVAGLVVKMVIYPSYTWNIIQETIRLPKWLKMKLLILDFMRDLLFFRYLLVKRWCWWRIILG